MNQESQVRILRELFRQIDNRVNVDAGVQYLMPTSSYTCPDLAQKEWNTFFREHPQLIGLSGDLPGPGTYFTVEDFGVPVLATRDGDGKFHAFLNACRHRGARVADGPRGKRRVFVCPFHSWSYSSEGKLLAVPDMDHFGHVEKSCHGLISLPAEERDGLLWVHPQPAGVLDIDKLLGPLAEELSMYEIEELKFGGEKTIDMDLNWKLANDTFGETYHFSKLHKDTLGNVFYGNNLAYEEFGRNHRFVTANKTIDALRDKPESEWRLREAALTVYYLFPNIQLIANTVGFTLVRMYPDPRNPGHSITRISVYSTPELVDADLNVADQHVITTDRTYAPRELGDVPSPGVVLEVFSSTIEQEDYLMGKQQQSAAESGLLSHSIFGRNEPPLHHFHNTFREALGMSPLEQL